MRNHISVHGYLGRKPEVKTYTDKDGNEKSRTEISVGVSRDYGDGTDWFDVTFFGKKGEVIDKFFDKGSQIICWGRMESFLVKGDDGKNRKFWKIVGEGFDFCDSKDSPRGQNNPAVKGPKDDDIPDSFEAAEDDIPF